MTFEEFKQKSKEYHDNFRQASSEEKPVMWEWMGLTAQEFINLAMEDESSWLS